jgi:hypothetical protein
MTTTHTPTTEGSKMHGTLPNGTDTRYGTIVGRTDTAYIVADWEGDGTDYVAFRNIDGPYTPAAILCGFGPLGTEAGAL